MLSYVIPAQETSPTGNSASAQRNLSLNLSPQQPYSNKQNTTITTVTAATNQIQTQSKSKILQTKTIGVTCGNNASSVNTKDVDAMLANVVNDENVAVDSCNEHTRLLGAGTPPRPRRQNSNNNNFSNNNNSLNNSAGAGARCIGSGGGAGTVVGGGAGILNDSIHDDALSEDASDISDDKQQPRQMKKKPKLSKLGSKSVGLKRVSFGSSKGSMVETLVFETPTPLSEHVEVTFGFEADNQRKIAPTPNINTNYSSTSTKNNIDDSGIEVQEESERSIVRVSIYQSSQPQQICPPEYLTRFEDNLDNSYSNYNCNLEDIMTAATIPGYDRQQSTDSGWDNPFQPGGDLSREADEIVNMIRGGKPITPTEDHSVVNGNAQREDNCNGTTVVENVTKANVTQNQSAQNGTNSHKVQSTSKSPENNGVTSLAHVSKQVVPGPTSASHVVIDEKKNKKKGCCVIQ